MLGGGGVGGWWGGGWGGGGGGVARGIGRGGGGGGEKVKGTECLAQGQTHSRYSVQEYLGETAGSIPDRHNKANIAIKQATRIFVSQHTVL